MIVLSAHYSGVCVGGPWDGIFHVHHFRNVESGVFNLIAPNDVRGSYTISGDLREWRWGPWRAA